MFKPGPAKPDFATLLGARINGRKAPTLDRPKVSFPAVKPRVGDYGPLRAPRQSLGEALEAKMREGLSAVGLDRYAADRWAGKTFSAFNNLTPVGNAVGMDDGARTVAQGVTQGDIATGALGAGVMALNLLPGGGGAKRKVADMLRDRSGAIRAWHGSPHDFDKFELSDRTIGSGDGAQSYGHGLYFTDSPEVAGSYRAESDAGRLYETNINADPSAFIDLNSEMGPTGGELYSGLADSLGRYRGDLAGRRAASAALAARGIPGAKSRGLGGSHNYVMFDDSLIDIVNKY